MRATLEKNRAEAIQSTTDETVKARAKDNRLFYYVIPITFYASRYLFEKGAWTPEEVREGQQLGAFIAWIASNPALAIERTEPTAFRAGLVRLSNWFAMMCRNDKTLPLMLSLTDDLFLGGEAIDVSGAASLTVVARAPIPGSDASFVVLSDGARPEPLVIGVLNSDGKARWLKRYTAAPLGAIAGVAPHENGVKKLDEHGYVCWLRANLEFGTTASRVYLDRSLNLRFYYISS